VLWEKKEKGEKARDPSDVGRLNRNQKKKRTNQKPEILIKKKGGWWGERKGGILLDGGRVRFRARKTSRITPSQFLIGAAGGGESAGCCRGKKGGKIFAARKGGGGRADHMLRLGGADHRFF